jgi:cytochrome P450
MINARTDTTATIAEWIMAELMAHPDIRKQVQGEIDIVVGLNCIVQESDIVVGLNCIIQESDIANLPLLQAIIKETFRLRNYIFIREA